MRLALTNLGSKLSSTDIRQTQLVARTNVFRLRKNLMTAVCYDLLGWGGKNISKLGISNLKMRSSDSFAKFCYICSQIDSQRSINPLLVSKVSRVYSKGKWTNNSWGFKACDVLFATAFPIGLELSNRNNELPTLSASPSILSSS